MKSFLVACSTLAATAYSADCNDSVCNYNNGGEDWSDIKHTVDNVEVAKYPVCGTGEKQSPINLRGDYKAYASLEI